jgi:hypothetical protein
MFRWMTFAGVLCFVTAAPPDDLLAQFNPYGNRYNPYAPAAESNVDPRVRRAYREKAVAIVGPKGRDFVESQGDEAVVAIFACSKSVAAKLVEFYSSGEMGKLPRPRDLLRVIALPRHGDDVALWAIHHASELADMDNFDAYLLGPLDYALGLKQLEAGAAETRARRLSMAVVTTPPPTPPLLADERVVAFGVGGFLVVIALLLWRRRQSSGF